MREAVCPMPPAAPLPMPEQSLRRAPKVRFDWPDWRVFAARLISFGGALAVSAFGAYQLFQAFDPESISRLQLAMCALFVLVFAWIAFSACTGLAGLLFGPRRPELPEQEAGEKLASRTAIVMPVYNEDAAATCGALAAMGEGIAALGHGGAFEIFVISDTRDPDIFASETTAFIALRDRLEGQMKVWYRRRADNEGRKAGNVQDFVERWGARYDFMLVLDADSLMAPDTIVEMVRRIEAAPKLALLQTNPSLVGGTTPFARLQQFAGALYGPIVARGVAAWQGLDGNFWGHNALIRVKAFAESAGLPHLPGRKPFGGHVMSHDFVEAALLRRAGWDVRMDPDLEGSWEGAPPSLITAGQRDRRWAQGNIQHLNVIGAVGLRWPNRVHFAIGIGSYLVSPLWLALLLVGFALTVQVTLFQPTYFQSSFQLFPNWPKFDAVRMTWLFAGSMALLLLPKMLGIGRSLFNPVLRQRLGGGFRILMSAIAEILLSALFAPVLMLIQCRHVVEILLGRDSGWAPQERSGVVMPWKDAFHVHGFHATVGAAVSIGLYVFRPEMLVWLSPILLGLVLAPALSRFSGDERAGKRLAGWGLMSITEERHVPWLLTEAETAAWDIRVQVGETLLQLAEDRRLASAHLHALSWSQEIVAARASEQHKLDRITAAAKIKAAAHPAEALGWMTHSEKDALACEPELFAMWSGVRLPKAA